jgi:hypothetical protein
MELVSFRPFNRSSIYNRIGLQKMDLTDKSLLLAIAFARGSLTKESKKKF